MFRYAFRSFPAMQQRFAFVVDFLLKLLIGFSSLNFAFLCELRAWRQLLHLLQRICDS